jgi:RNA polymerase sigma-70 factor (ECF subfamily)
VTGNRRNAKYDENPSCPDPVLEAMEVSNMPIRDPGQPSPPRTQSIVERVCAGDRERFGDLYDRIAPSIYTWARLKLRVSSFPCFQPEDIVQETWLRALCAFSTYDPHAAPFRRWIYGIVRNVMCEALRAIGRQLPELRSPGLGGSSIFDLDALPKEVTSLSERVARDESIGRFAEKLESLDAEERTLVSLRGLEGLSFGEIARFMQISEEAARKRWERLRRRLIQSGPPEGVLGDLE